MSNYRRLLINGGTYFFTLVTHNRQPILCENNAIIRLKASFRYVMKTEPFKMEAIVILPDHLHCIWTLPKNDADFSTRWSKFKRYFSIGINKESNHRREKLIWQNRFWEHAIRNENDLQMHLNYIHYNPVKHGYTLKPIDWPYSSFKKYVTKGYYEENWGANREPDDIKNSIME